MLVLCQWEKFVVNSKKQQTQILLNHYSQMNVIWIFVKRIMIVFPLINNLFFWNYDHYKSCAKPWEKEMAHYKKML